MSGICASLRFDGRQAEQGELAPVLAALASRGPDGSALVSDGPVALGHALLATTPEALLEVLPLRHAPTGCLITADVRLDNREDLLSRLGLESKGRVIGDGELILETYLRWGTECPTHLLGDFAFVIWDPRHQRLFGARDKAGMKQLIYHAREGTGFFCASDVLALVRHRDVPQRINEVRIADFLEGFEAIDLSSTFFCDIYRLPPAHALLVENGTVRSWQYWQLVPPPMVRRSSDAEYAEALLEVLGRAVKARMRSPDPVGSMLSGGLDSGTVTVIAAGLQHHAGGPALKTFSAIDNDPDCLESRAIRASLGIANIDPHLVSIADADGFRDEVARLQRNNAEPFDAPMAMVHAIYLAARGKGIKVMLDGVAGDTTLPTGDVVAHLVGQGRMLAAWKEAVAQERFWDGQVRAAREFRVALRTALLPTSINTRLRRRWLEQEHRKAALASLVHPDLAARIDLPARRWMHDASISLGRDCSPTTQALRMLHPHIIVARERYDRVASASGIEPRDPFLDTRVMEFCLTLPVEQIHSDGWPKLILRRMMTGKLPESVLWKTGRHHVGWRFIDLCAGQSDAIDPVTLHQLFQFTRSKGRYPDGLSHSSPQIEPGSLIASLAAWIGRVQKPE